MPLELRLGTVLFKGMEIPETIGPIGGVQLIQANDFPGGIRTIKTFGAFAAAVSWRGVLTGNNAFTRSLQLDRLRVVGNEINLQYGEFYWTGVVTEYLARPRNQWHVPYEIQFQTATDASIFTTAQSQLSQLQARVLYQLKFISDVYGGEDTNLFAIPAALNAPSGAALTAMQTALTNASGNIQNITTDDLTALLAALAALIAAAEPLTLSTDPTIASPSLDLMNSALNLSNLFTAEAEPQFQVKVINPNLYLLAAQYLGDASQWKSIAALNDLLDPMPIGDFTLLIPQPAT